MSDDHLDHTKQYLKIFGALVVLTIVTVLVSQIPGLGEGMGLILAMAIASVKALDPWSLLLYIRWYAY